MKAVSTEGWAITTSARQTDECPCCHRNTTQSKGVVHSAQGIQIASYIAFMPHSDDKVTLSVRFALDVSQPARTAAVTLEISPPTRKGPETARISIVEGPPTPLGPTLSKRQARSARLVPTIKVIGGFITVSDPAIVTFLQGHIA